MSFPSAGAVFSADLFNEYSDGSNALLIWLDLAQAAIIRIEARADSIKKMPMKITIMFIAVSQSCGLAPGAKRLREMPGIPSCIVYDLGCYYVSSTLLLGT